jgi:hypothetical protein
MLGAGMLPSGKPVITSRVGAPPKGPTFQFGEYILSYQDCRECHGPRSSPKIGWNVGFGSWACENVSAEGDLRRQAKLRL